MSKPVVIYKDGDSVGTLGVGMYDTSKLEGFEKVEVPAQTGLVFYGDPADANALALFEDDVYVVDAKIGQYQKMVILDLAGTDLSILKLRDSELSDSELLSVVGGAGAEEDPMVNSCKCNACGGEVCLAAL